jgi:predicted GNAT family N-acyltransferase
MKADIKYANYLDKFEVISFIEKCLFENNQPFNKKTIDADLNNFKLIYCQDNMLIFRINGKIIGTSAYKIEIRHNVKNIKIVRVYLDSKHRGFGYGKILFMTLLGIIRTKHKNVKVAYLSTNSETMAIAYNMYKFFGFKECDDFNINKERSNTLMKLML